MRVDLNDDLVEDIRAGLKPGASLEMELERRLKATRHVRAAQPLIVLDIQQMDEITDRIGTGLPIRDRAGLYRALDQVAQLKLGNVRLAFTPTMLSQIEERARKIGETTERFVARVASKILTDIFLVPPPESDAGVFYQPGFDPTTEIEDEEEPVGEEQG